MTDTLTMDARLDDVDQSAITDADDIDGFLWMASVIARNRGVTLKGLTSRLDLAYAASVYDTPPTNGTS